MVQIKSRTKLHICANYMCSLTGVSIIIHATIKIEVFSGHLSDSLYAKSGSLLAIALVAEPPMCRSCALHKYVCLRLEPFIFYELQSSSSSMCDLSLLFHILFPVIIFLSSLCADILDVRVYKSPCHPFMFHANSVLDLLSFFFTCDLCLQCFCFCDICISSVCIILLQLY